MSQLRLRMVRPWPDQFQHLFMYHLFLFFLVFFSWVEGSAKGPFFIVSDQWLEYSLLTKLETQDIPALHVLIPVRISSSLASQTSADCFQHHARGMKGVVTPGRFLCAMSRFLCSSDWLWSHDFELISLCEIGRLWSSLPTIVLI